MAKVNTLGKGQRLKSRKQIERVFREGRAFSIFPFRVSYILEAPPAISGKTIWLQAGFGASSRNFKRAVHRNRIKRLTREAYRLQRHALAQMLPAQGRILHVFFIYVGKELPEYHDLSQKIGVILQKLQKLVQS